MKKEKIINLILAIVGIILVGTGVAFNAAAALGNDPIGIVYDGIRNAADLSAEQLGTASNIVNIVLVILVFFLDKHYVNIGTFIYIIPYSKNGLLYVKGNRQNLADETGLCLKSISRGIKKFLDDGLITKDGNQILINEEQYEGLKKMISSKIDLG